MKKLGLDFDEKKDNVWVHEVRHETLDKRELGGTQFVPLKLFIRLNELQCEHQSYVAARKLRLPSVKDRRIVIRYQIPLRDDNHNI